ELRQGIASEPERLRDLREHLILWELWSQEHAPHRSAEAFCSGFQVRLRAEQAGNDRAVTAVAAPAEVPGRGVAVAWRPEPWRCLLSAAPVVLFARAFAVFRPRPSADPAGPVTAPQAARPVSLRGEAVCTHCILSLTDHCQLAIRVHEHGH